MTNPRHLGTVLDWDRMTRWRYHTEKAAHSAFIGLVIFAVTSWSPVISMLLGAALYLVVGKLTVGRSHHPAPWLELLDWIADAIIGSAGAAIAVWAVYGLVLGLAALGAWVLLYITITYRFAIP